MKNFLKTPAKKLGFPGDLSYIYGVNMKIFKTIKVMNKLLLFTCCIFIFASCEKEVGYINPESFLELSTDLEYDGYIYTYNYPVNDSNYASNSYFKINFQSTPQERVYWDSPNEFYTIVWNDTIWDSCVNYSTYANDEGIGHQLVYVNPQFIGDTLNIIATIENYGDQIEEKIKIKIQ